MSPMTDLTDRLAEIKGWLNGETQPDNYTWESAVFERMDWLIAEVERLRAELGNAADIMEAHLDEPQAVSHAELRASAQMLRSLIDD